MPQKITENVRITLEFIHVYDHDENTMRPTPQDYTRALGEEIKAGHWVARIGNPVIVSRSEEEL